MQQRSIAQIRVMIAAAGADGHIEAEEKQTILARLGDQKLDAETLAFLRAELEADVDVAKLAALASNAAESSEM